MIRHLTMIIMLPGLLFVYYSPENNKKHEMCLKKIHIH